MPRALSASRHPGSSPVLTSSPSLRGTQTGSSCSVIPLCVLRGNMFMGLSQDSLILRLAEADRAEFLGRYDTGPVRADAWPADERVRRCAAIPRLRR